MGCSLTFADPVSDAVADAGNWFAQQWNYRYGPAYGVRVLSAPSRNSRGIQSRGNPLRAARW
ncbi:MAG: hypothetical protein R3F31_04240 [Verrucomicrobiales bacterium]